MTEEISVTKKIGSGGYIKENPALVFSEGQVIKSRYKILEKLGSGGFGSVYKAIDSILEKEVAVKFLNPDCIDSAKKFHRVKREINISRKITDKRVVKIYSLEEHEGIHFLVMEYLQGKSLKDKLKKESVIDWREFRPVFINIMKGVKALHDQGIIHRDLKPSNIMLLGGDEIKILDFGMSKEIDDLEMTSSIGELIGSPYYMSPEQANMTDLDMRSDIYQLGLILYRCLIGKMPFGDSQNTFELIYKRVVEKPEKLDRKKVKVPNYVEFALFKSIEKKRENRFDSINEMAEYFENRSYSFCGKVVHNLKKFKWRLLSVSSLILFTLLGLVFWFSDKEVSSVQFDQSSVSAYNNLGIRLWKKNCEPYTINTSFILNSSMRVESDINRENLRVDSKKIITLLNNHTKIDNASIVSGDFDNKVSVLTKDGKELDKIGFFISFDLGRYDFFKKFYTSKIINRDIDKDGKMEKILFIRHFMDMYPTAFVLIKDSYIYSFANPGTIADYKFLMPDSENTRILFYGINNILSHLFFVAEVKFPKKGSFLIKQSGIPNLKQSNIYLPEFLCFIPNLSNYDHSGWDATGSLKFSDYRTGNKITLTKDYKLTINDGKTITTYNDNKDALYRAYRLINQYYTEKLVHRNNKSAYKLINKSLELNPQNPFLRSALLFFKGDLEVEMGNPEMGRKTLENSLESYMYNRDAAQRLCELDFLEGNPDIAYRRASEELGHINTFWGISSGKEIFKSYCKLQLGDFSKAREILSLSVFKSNLSNSRTFLGILSLFSGEYMGSLKRFSTPDKNRIFTIAENRLLLSRALLLTNSDIKKAEFYFSDIALHSLSLSYLARISNHYLKLKNGAAEVTGRDVKREFNELVNLSRGDFHSKLWLFYDAYLYGRIMEMLDNREEAIRGYKLSIDSNPYTDLAGRSRSRLKILNFQFTEKD